jgi:hypothetical protein
VALTFKSAATGAADALDWEVAFNASLRRRISTAAWLALQDVGTQVDILGRIAIKRGGFGPKWQSAWKSKVYPSDKPSIDAALYTRHKVPYAGIFETGGTVKGNPLMWIPTRNVPVLGGRLRKMTPARFAKTIGPLSGPRRTPGSNRTPVLFGRLPGSKKRVPMFIGVRSVFQKKRFNVGAAVVSAASKFPRYYERRLAVTDERRMDF